MAIGLAATSVALASTFLDGINLFGFRMQGTAKENVMVYLFLFMFVASALMLSSILLGNTRLKQNKARAALIRKQQATRPPAKPQANDLPASDVDSLTFKKDGEQDSEPKTAAEIEAEDAAAAATEEAIKAATQEAGAHNEKSEDGVIQQEFGEENSGPSELSPHEQKQKTYMLQFITQAMDGAGQNKTVMSNFDKFGVSLYLAGACETMSQKSDISGEAKSRIMADSVQAMGFKRNHASSFAEKYDEYLVQDPTYMQMFHAGRNAMNVYLTDESRISKNMGTAMEEWNIGYRCSIAALKHCSITFRAPRSF